MNPNNKPKQTETKAQVKKKQRSYYDASFKKLVVEDSRRLGNRYAAKKHNIDEKNVRRWKQNYDRICRCAPKRKSFTGPKKGKFQEVERRVLDWIQEQRGKCMPVSIKIIRIKALRIARELDVTSEQFKASLGWTRRMMRRSGLVLRKRTNIAQKLPNDYEEKLLEYQRYVIKLRQMRSYALTDMGNADETPVSFDMPSSRTVNETGAKTVSIRTTSNEKQRISVMLTVLADGTKLPPFIILKRKTLPKEDLPRGLFIRCQEKGWMTTELMFDWFKNVWMKRPLRENRSMLVLDAFRGHLKPEFKKKVKSNNTDLVIIPGGMTSMLQVLDVVVNKPFKDYLTEQYSAWLIENDHEFTKAGRIKKPTISNLCTWIEGWDTP